MLVLFLTFILIKVVSDISNVALFKDLFKRSVYFGPNFAVD